MEKKRLEENYIDFIELVQYYLKTWWLIVAGCMIGVVVAGIYTFKIATPIYEASSMVYMSGSGSEDVISYQDLQIGAALTKDYEVIFTSRPILESIIKDLNLEMSWKELRNRLILKNETDTRILKIAFQDEDPELASNIVNRLVENGMKKVQDIYSNESYLIEEAVADWDMVSPSHSRDLMMGALFGIALVVVVMTINYILNDRIHSVKDVEQILQLPVFCIVPESSSCSYKNISKKSMADGKGIEKIWGR